MAWTNAKTAVVGGALVGLTVVSVWQHRAQADLRRQNEALQREVTQVRAENQELVAVQEAMAHQPPPPAPVIAVVATNAPGKVEATNLFARFHLGLTNRIVNLTPEQTEAFLSKNGRNAATLLAAFRTSGNPDLLKEAMEKYPNDPQVAFEAVAFNAKYFNDSTDQRKWLDAFEKSAPDNSLANYLSALNYFNSGQVEQGIQDMTAGTGKSLNDYTLSRCENDMEAYLSAGYTVPEAEVLSTSQLMLPQLAQIKQLALDSADLAKAYNQAGYAESAQAVLQGAYQMGQQYATQAPGESTISQLVGLAVQKIALSGMDPNATFGDSGQTVQDIRNQLTQQQTSVRQMASQAENYLPSLTDQDWVAYKNRWMMLGEQNAEQWVVSKYGQQ